MNDLQEERGVDVVHVERRVLAQQDHIEFGQFDLARHPQRRVTTGHALHCHVAAARENAALVHGQGLSQIDEQTMAPRLGALHHQEGRIALDVDPLDGVHLDSNLQRHANFPRFRL